jgi:hypothetical protein
MVFSSDALDAARAAVNGLAPGADGELYGGTGAKSRRDSVWGDDSGEKRITNPIKKKMIARIKRNTDIMPPYHDPLSEPPLSPQLPLSDPPESHEPLSEPDESHEPLSEPPESHEPLSEPPESHHDPLSEPPESDELPLLQLELPPPPRVHPPDD